MDPGHPTGPYSQRTSLPRLLVVLLVAIGLLAACNRTQFRHRADAQTYGVLAEKSSGTVWEPPRTDITPDPRSRFFDQSDLDFPPLPPDDPSAHQYMQQVYGMNGWKHWYDFGTLDHVENPEWTTYLGGEPFAGPQFPLPSIESVGLSEAIELGLIHSREYQEQLENMYLSALALTFERYRFDVRPLGFLGEPGTNISYEHQPDDASNLQLGTTNLGVSKLLPGGAQFIAELTNNTIWLFSGPNSTQSASTFAYSLVVPLLERGRREVTLERLTQTERRVLYTIRDFARFRKDFYVTIVTGERALPLPGNTGGAELAFLIRGERAPTVGFYFLLFTLQRARNQETNVRSLENLIRDLDQLGAAGRATALDVTQLESSLASARRRFILLDRFYRDQLDRFKVQLGLPPDINLEINDEIIAPFQFLNLDLLDLEVRVSAIPLDEDADKLAAALEGFRSIQEELDRHLATSEMELMRLGELIPERSRWISEREVEQLLADFEQDQRNFADVRSRVQTTQEKTRGLAMQIGEQETSQTLAALRDVRRETRRAVRELLGLQIGVRVELVTLKRVNLTPEDAVQMALGNRLDLMNRRGFVTDARRRLEVAADRLQGTLNLVAAGEVNTPDLANNRRPMNFRSKDSNFRVGVSVVTPLDRRAARNNFRAAQISLQRARRNFMAAEDQVKLDVRSALREVVAQAGTFETNRRALRVAARELDQAIEFSERPDTGRRAGNQGVNISRALDNILDAQDELIESWVDYETGRLSLFRDVGVMFIDPNGFWIEESESTSETVPPPPAEVSRLPFPTRR